MASPIGLAGLVNVQSDNSGSSIPIHISEQAGVQAENLSLSTWGASFVLANLLHKFEITPAGANGQSRRGAPKHYPAVLELGAGTGLVGISAAALWHTYVMLTDLRAILPGLSANVALNGEVLIRGSAQCGTLDWNRPEEINVLPSSSADGAGRILTPRAFQAEVILAADTIYSEEHPTLLAKTITKWLAYTPTSRAILCYPLRIAYIDHIREFWDLMEASGLECVDEGREAGEDSWNEIASTPYEYCVWRWRQAESTLSN